MSDGGRPANVLLLTSDQHHWTLLGSRTPGLHTPNLDRLAAEGASVERAYCTNPTCSPSRASIITGQYPSSHGCWSLGTKLEESRPTVGHLLAEAGYQTSLIGKAHLQPLASAPDQTSIEAQPLLRDLDHWAGFHGPWYGFDHVELARMHGDESHVGQHYALWLEARGVDWRRHFRSWPPEPGEEHRWLRWDLPEEHHYSAWTAERSIAAIDRAADAGDPFLCWASFHDPHPPYLAPEPWASMYDPADIALPEAPTAEELAVASPWVQLAQEAAPDFSGYLETGFHVHGFTSHSAIPRDLLRQGLAVHHGMISLLDHHVGRILAHLDERGLTDDTLVVFTTDHGNLFGQHGLVAKGPFHYEDLIRVPFLARWPGRIPPGSAPPGLLSLVDLAPTFLGAAGVPAPGWMQGVDQAPALAGEVASARRVVVVEDRFEPTKVSLRTYVDARHKLTVAQGQAWGELYDLVEDPGEVRNRFDDPAAAGLRARLTEQALDAELVREPLPTRRVANA